MHSVVLVVRIWNEMMKKYKVAELCEAELSRLRNLDEDDRKAYLQLEQAKAVLSKD